MAWTEEDERKDAMNEELIVKIAFSLVVFTAAIAIAVMVSGCTPQPPDTWITTVQKD